MKSRHVKPHPELVRMSTLTLNTGDPPQLKIDEVFTSMNGASGFSPLIREASPPLRINGSGMSNGSLSDPHTPPRRSTSSGKLLTTSPRSAESHAVPVSSPATALGESAAADGVVSPQWSSAVGRATTGKSGRVIEKLQAENDRLRRELKFECLRREEEQKKGEMARGKMESLQATNDNLIQIREAEMASMARKTRKLDELKVDLESERSRRLEAERQLKSIMMESERTEEEMRQQLREESEKARRAASQYDVLSSTWRQLDDGYRRKTEKLRKDMAQVNAEYTEDRRRLGRLEIIIEQQRHELEKTQQAKEAISKHFDSYKQEAEDSTREMREAAERNDQSSQQALADTLQVLGEMRHIINVKKYVRGAE
ncbi:MAG: hypothetical protein M1825_002295 [Sarcosagium campestre]|nr:MAG: hypothetical protein M1825_002295 [Sarcosagium campestre]